MKDLIVYSQDHIAQGIIDTQISLLWERRFFEAGYFEIHCPATENNNTLLKLGAYIMRADSLETGYVKYLRKETDQDSKSEVIAIGRFLSYLLYGHVIEEAQSITAQNAETVMRRLVSAVFPNTGGRETDNLYLGSLCYTKQTITIFINYGDDLYETLVEIAKRTGVGFRIILDPNNGRHYFECYEGKDLSANQYDNPQVIFSPDYDTILGDVSYTEDDSDTVNAVVAQYYGELGRVEVNYNPTNAQGLHKHEKFITGEPVTYRDAQGTHLDESATRASLLEAAKRTILLKNTNVSASVVAEGSYKYKEDYDIGDIVTIQYKPYDIELTKRIERIAENYSDTGIEHIVETCELYPGGKEET